MERMLKYGEEKHAEEKKELEAKIQGVETKLEELAGKMKEGKDELEKKKTRSEGSTSKPRTEVVESLRKEIASNFSNNALTKASVRDVPIVLISAWQPSEIRSPQTVTFSFFLANFNNAGGGGVLDLHSGIFTCFSPGFYTVSYSAYSVVGPDYGNINLFLFKNGIVLPESMWYFGADAINANIGVVGSRIVILHLDEGDTLELRMANVD